MSYEEWQPTQGPPWLQRRVGGALQRQFGALKDNGRDRLNQAVKARFPDHSPSDGLDEIGRDRMIDKGVNQTEASFRLSLRKAWDTWSLAGTAKGILLELKNQGFAPAYVVQHNGKYSYLDGSDEVVSGLLSVAVNRPPGTEPGWMFDLSDTFYTQFGILIDLYIPTLTPGSEDAARVTAIARRLKPAKMHYRGAWVRTNTGTLYALGWTPNLTLGTAPNLASNRVLFIPPVT